MAIIGYMQAKGKPFYSNNVIWLHQVTVPLHQGTVLLFVLRQIQSNDVTQIIISSETHTYYIYTIWEIETPNLWFTQMASQCWGGGGKIFCLYNILAPVCFLWNNLWSVWRYVMGPFRLVEVVWEWPVISKHSPLKMYVRNQWSPIHIFHGFASKLQTLHKCDNSVHYVFADRRCDKPDSIQFMKGWQKYVT